MLTDANPAKKKPEPDRARAPLEEYLQAKDYPVKWNMESA